MRIFGGMMVFTILVWMWTVAFIIATPWKKTAEWQPEFRLAAICKDDVVCGINYGQLDAAKASGRVVSLVLKESDEAPEETSWLKWTLKDDGIYQVRASSWNFQSTIRYRVVDEVPVLVEVQILDINCLFYGMGAALFTLTGLYLRKLRKR